jgi:hypothetical protein
VTARGPVARILIGFGLLCGVVIALASSVVLHGAGLVAVVVVAGLVACVVFSTWDDRRAARGAAWKAAGSTVATIMLVVGVGVLAGGAAATLFSVLAMATGGAVWLGRGLWARSTGRSGRDRAPAAAAAPVAPLALAGWLDGSSSPVSLLPISGLGSEWSRTTAALACGLEPTARLAVVRRRQEVLDELERRDPAGFESWLVAGAATNSDPASFLRSGRATGTDAA